MLCALDSEADMQGHWACFTPGTEFHSVRIFILGHLEFEYAGYLFAAFPPRHQPADWPVAPCGSAAVRQANRLVDADAGMQRKGTLRAAKATRMVTGDVRLMPVVRHRSRESSRSPVTE